MVNKDRFVEYLSEVNNFDFSNNAIQASGIGRKDIRNTLLYASGLINEEDMKPDDFDKIMSFRK